MVPCSGLHDSNPSWHLDAVSGSHPPHPLLVTLQEKQPFDGYENMKTLIASHIFSAINPQGEKFEISIGLEIPAKDHEGIWWCPVHLSPFLNKVRPIAGGDSFQSICLSIALIRSVIDDFVEKGGQVPSSFHSSYPMGVMSED